MLKSPRVGLALVARPHVWDHAEIANLGAHFSTPPALKCDFAGDLAARSGREQALLLFAVPSLITSVRDNIGYSNLEVCGVRILQGPREG